MRLCWDQHTQDTLHEITLDRVGVPHDPDTARVPQALVEALDAAAIKLKRNRADIIRQALEQYLDDFDDLTDAVERLRDPADAVLDWDQIRRELLASK